MWHGLGEGPEPRPLSLSLCDSNEQPLISNITAYVRDKLRAGEPRRRIEVGKACAGGGSLRASRRAVRIWALPSEGLPFRS